MLLDILDDVFLLHFSFEPPEGAFNRFALLNLDFSHASDTPSPRTILPGKIC
jgi:hypothetical protein